MACGSLGRMCWPIIVIVLFTLARAQNVWTQGGASGVLTVSTDGPLYSFVLANSTAVQLQGVASRVHCNQSWQTVGTSALPLQQCNIYSGLAGGLGTFEALDRVYGPTHSSFLFVETFRYYSALDVFEFAQSFPAGCTDMATLALPSVGAAGLGTEFSSATVTSTEFPAWELAPLVREAVGYITWQGRFVHDDSTHGVGLSGFVGGAEGGPLVLFDAQTGLLPSTLVLAPSDRFFATIFAVTLENASAACACFNQTDFEGNDLFPPCASTTSNAQECCAACQLNPDCAAFSWLGADPDPVYTNKCCLKSSSAGVTPNPTHTSGIARNMTLGGRLVAGVQGFVTALPAGYNSSVLLSALARGGINAAVDKFGIALRAKHNTTRLTPDILVEKLGYWTDNGGYFYGGNPLSAADAMTLFQNLRAGKVPVSYLQLDPFWYPADQGNASCCLTWTARPDLFPNGVAAVSAAIGVPLLLYSSYFCPAATAHAYNVSFVDSRPFNVGWASGVIADVAPDASYAFYSAIMGPYADNGSLVAFEVDFMDFNLLLVDAMLVDPFTFEQWAQGMSDAAHEHHLPIQYCMGLASQMMNSLRLPAVTNARASEDKLVDSIVLRPFFDVVWTAAVCPGSPYASPRDNIALQLTVAVLSAGPLGIGDGIGCTNTTLLAQSCMSDGTLLHPARAATPLDRMYLPAPPPGQLWATHAAVSAFTVWTLLVVDVTAPYLLTFADLFPRPSASGCLQCFVQGDSACAAGQSASACVHTLCANGTLSLHTSPQDPVTLEHSFVVWTAVPVLPSGLVVLGETSKIVAWSPQRFLSVTCTGTTTVLVLAGAPMEQTFIRVVFPVAAAAMDAVIVDVPVVFSGVSRRGTLTCDLISCNSFVNLDE